MGACCYDDDRPDIYNEFFRKAIKSHICCECGGDIKAGEEYQIISMLYDGSWSDYKTCEPCADLRDALMNVDCPALEGLAECYYYYLSDRRGSQLKAGKHTARLLAGYPEHLTPDE